MIRLICMDLDGVLIPRNNFWLELHKAFGTLEEGAKISKRHAGDQAMIVKEIVSQLWAGRDAQIYQQLVDSYSFLPGLDALFIELDRFVGPGGERVPRAILTGGCYDVASRLADQYSIEFLFANKLFISDGKISGEYQWPIGTAYTKRQIIEQLCDDFNILPQEVLVIGDSDGDIEAFRIAGVSIAFNATSKQLKSEATYVVDSDDLHDLLPVLETIRASNSLSPAGSPKI